MIIQVKPTISNAEENQLLDFIKEFKLSPSIVNTQFGKYIIAVGKNYPDMRLFSHFESILDLHRVSENYKLVSKKWKLDYSTVDLGDNVIIGGGQPTIMAGPCSIEGIENIEDTIAHLKANNINIMRGGVYKPRSSPYSFRGLGIEGLKDFHAACKKEGIKIITEVMQSSQIDDMMEYVDIFQVGARNAQNFNLLDALGKIDKPVMLKRGISGTIEEQLQAAEYVFSNGNEKILLCERGIRSYENAYRNTFDVNAISILKEKSHLPVIADPSHGVGIRKHVGNVALASVMAGADGVIVEVHKEPNQAFSDGQQNLNFQEAEKLYKDLRGLWEFKQRMV
ncbi:MAG: 3-deoxy-7-phosphoheptulonate synthase [Flavobacteriales bacterium]|jgi:3-deoxy-7-phosphoheptulonate synthase